MNFNELVNKTVSFVDFGTREQTLKSVKSWIAKDYTLYVTDGEAYGEHIEKLYEIDEKISSRFSRKAVYDYLHNKVAEIKLSGKDFNQEKRDFFKPFYDVTPRNLTVTAPISGIRLDNGIDEFNLSIYKFGYLKYLETPIANDNGMYISVVINNVYDKNIAISQAENAFLDFAKLIVFISGKLDRSILITTGLSLKPDLTHERMYVNTFSYQIADENGLLDSAQISNNHLEKIPVNNDFFCKNEELNKLWELYEAKHNGKKLKDIESRLLNSALALGESAMTPDAKNSIIYTCISLEILFSYDEASLFQRSIGEKLSDIFSFVVAKDIDSRLLVSRHLKKVYGMRSAIVHGGNKELSNENLPINFLMRGAINDLLNNEKFKHINTISQIYELLKIAQNSY